jgi:hypothetical protein
VLGANGATGEFHGDYFVLGLTHLDCVDCIEWDCLFMLVVSRQGAGPCFNFWEGL